MCDVWTLYILRDMVNMRIGLHGLDRGAAVQCQTGTVSLSRGCNMHFMRRDGTMA